MRTSYLRNNATAGSASTSLHSFSNRGCTLLCQVRVTDSKVRLLNNLDPFPNDKVMGGDDALQPSFFCSSRLPFSAK